jgi:hypothetical protein
MMSIFESLLLNLSHSSRLTQFSAKNEKTGVGRRQQFNPQSRDKTDAA